EEVSADGGLLFHRLNIGGRYIAYLPGQTIDIQIFHEGIRIKLFHVPDAWLLPFSFQDHLGSDHSRYTGGVGNCLRFNLFVTGLVITHVVDKHRAFNTVFHTGRQTANTGLAFSQRAQTRRVGQQRLEELQGHYLLAFKHDWLNGGHAHVAEHFEVLEIIVRESHPETGTLDLGKIFGERLELFVIHQVNFLRAYLRREIVNAVYRQRLCFMPLSIFPIATLGCYFTDIDLGIEVGREGFAVITGITVDDVQVMNFIEVVLFQISREDVGNARIKTGTQQSHQTGFFKFILIIPLPGIFELGGIQRFVVGGIEIVNASFQTGIHDMQVLIRQGHVDDQIRFFLIQQRHQFRHIVRIYLGRLNGSLDLRSQGFAFFFVATGQYNL